MPFTKEKFNAQGYRCGTSPAQPVGFHGVTPAVQRAGAAQAAVAQTSAAVATANAADLPTAVALSNANKTAVNATVADIAALIALVNELRAALVEKGLVKGSA